MHKYLFVIIYTIFTFIAKAQIPPPPPNAIKKANDSSVMIQAKFPGGAQGWQKYLQKNLKADVAGETIKLKRRQKDSTETIIVSFLVDTLGNINEVKVENLNPVTPAVAAEAKRVIENGPQWLPATIDGRKVIYRQKQSISFNVSKD